MDTQSTSSAGLQTTEPASSAARSPQVKARLPLAPSKLTAPITELYTDTIQGEGATIGKLSSFIRFTGCHRSCSWCDSTHSWKAGEVISSKINIEDIMKTLLAGTARNIILTGGEPLLHQEKPYFKELIRRLLWTQQTDKVTLEIETEGSFAPGQALRDGRWSDRIRFNCSPKLANAGMGDLSDEYASKGDQGTTSIEALFLAAPTILKFVVASEADVQEAIALAEKAIRPHVIDREVKDLIYIMPEGQTKEVQLERMDETMDWALKYGLHFSPRLHVLRWNDERGV